MRLTVLVFACLCGLAIVLGCCKNYYVRTRTGGTLPNSGTDDWVDINVLMENGESGWQNLDSLWDDFRQGKTNNFNIGLCPHGKIVGLIMRLNIYDSATWRTYPNWFVESVWVASGMSVYNTDKVFCYFGEWMNSVDYSACVQKEYVAKWTAKLKAEGYFKGTHRRLYALRPTGRWFDNQPRCYYWSNGKLASKDKDNTICRRDEVDTWKDKCKRLRRLGIILNC